MVFQSIIDSINLELIFAQQIQRGEYAGNIIEEVCIIDSDLYNEELDTNDKRESCSDLPPACKSTAEEFPKQVDKCGNVRV